MKKIIGITCDDYKKDKFVEELKAANLEIISVNKMEGALQQVYLIKVFARQEDVAPVVKKVQEHFVNKYKSEN